MGYNGPERRDNADFAGMLARIDERTKMLVDNMDKLATIESVSAVRDKLENHIDAHQNKGGVIATWVGIGSALFVGIMGYFKK